MTGRFHPNSGVDRIYMSRVKRGRGLRSIGNPYESRIISLRQHLLGNANRNEILGYVSECEQVYIIRVGNELLIDNDITETSDSKPKSLSRKYTKRKQKNILQQQNILQITTQFEGYLEAIQDQEMPVKFLVRKRQTDSGQSPTTNNKCRLCKINIEKVNHIISRCPKISTRYYLPLGHDALAKYILILKAIITKNHPNERYRGLNEYEFVKKVGDKEYCWNISIKTATKIPHNKPDLVIWDKANKLCSIVEFSCPAYINITQTVNDKIDVYGLSIRNLQIMYPKYKINIILIIVGAVGYNPKCLTSYLQDLGFDKNESTVRIVKT